MRKEEKMLGAFGHLNDELIEEAAPRGRRRLPVFWTKAIAAAACIALIVGAFGAWLLIPYDYTNSELKKYEGSEYYPIIERLEELSARNETQYNNRLDEIFSGLVDSFDDISFGAMGGAMAPEDTGEVPWDEDKEALPDGETNGSYEETTDNQVSGVIEADIIKRSDKYIYYLNNEHLRIYSIKGEESEEISRLKISLPDDCLYGYYADMEFYLSQDTETVTLLYPYVNKDKDVRIAINSIDVKNPENVSSLGIITIGGSYISSRVVDGKLLLVSEYIVDGEIDYSKPETYVPSINKGAGDECIPMDSIILPGELTSTRYTMICKLDQSTMSLDGAFAFMSYSDEVYVSAESVYATRGYTSSEISGNVRTTESMTDISRLAYSGDSLSYLGTVSVEGYIKDRYSLDEFDGILRAVTTTSVSTSYVNNNGNILGFDIATDDYEAEPDIMPANSGTSANLYCIDLSNFTVAASVVGFAPIGETVRSVRFDGTNAYVCTAVQVTDPVFFFDLSDIDNITYKDTGNIKGFSTSLINLSNGYLLGIGVGSNTGTVKVEVYKEEGDSVVSVSSYETSGNYSEKYKSYFISREDNLFGFGVTMYNLPANEGERYILLFFDGYELRELVNTPLSGSPEYKRAVYIDGYLYMLSDEFKVVKVTK